MPKIEKLHNAVVKIKQYKNMNKSNGLFYLYGQNPTDCKTFMEQIKQDKKLADIEEEHGSNQETLNRKLS